MKHILARTTGLWAATLMLTGGVLVSAETAHAQAILEEQGTIIPAQREYSVTAEAGQVLAILMSSDEFDTVLSLLGPGSEEVAFNDDYGGTLNSRIIYRVPTDGEYTVVARSFSGQGGNFDLVVRAATPYEVSYDAAQQALQEGDYAGAIAAYSEAIELEPTNPEAYLGRADANFGRAFVAADAEGRVFEGPNDIPDDLREAIIADFEAALAIYEETGNTFSAQSLQEQINYLRTGESP
ncbi:MAG: tetratricopeptide repeat protein [Leptolyngbyaceae cyanobacterium T60_A2020_046]|nr:tetratricopeptide repeat protein [Leptolyngbyaceae cyanobacterium T60_A2020_046]